MNYRKGKLQSWVKKHTLLSTSFTKRKGAARLPTADNANNTAVWEPSQKSSSFLLRVFSKYGNKCQCGLNFLFSSLSFRPAFLQPAGWIAVTSRITEPPWFVFHHPFPNTRIMFWVPIKTAALLLILWLIHWSF